MKISNNGLNLIKQFEGFSSKPYLCPAGILTIGYGSTYYPNGKKVSWLDEEISEQKANEILEFIANKDFASCVNEVVKVQLNQNQFDALVSFCYNLGNGNFKSSTLLKKINLNDFKLAAKEFVKWNKSKGKVLDGLVKRRIKEMELFLK